MITIQQGLRSAGLHAAPWLAGLFVATCIAAPVGSREDPGQVEARFKQERAACLSGQSRQDTKTCLQEVQGARVEAHRGGLSGDPAAYTSNQRQRCEKLAGDDKRDCMARMQGQGTTEGSVAAGGILRTLVTREVVPQTPTAESASAAASAASASGR